MRLKQLLQIIDQLAQTQGMPRVYLVGGIPRDKVLGHINTFDDLDLTTGDESIHYLAKEVAIKFKNFSPQYQMMKDGHARVLLGNLKLDFSSNFNLPYIDNILRDLKIDHPSSMQKELYSRDFTCNTLLMSLDLKTIRDDTRQGLLDIGHQKLRTCVSPEITLGYDHKRVVRVIYLAAKLNFDIDPAILTWIKNNPATLADVPPDYLSKKLLKAWKFNPKKTVQLLTKLELWPYVPPLPEFLPYISKF